MSTFTEIRRSEHLPARIASEIGREITKGRLAPGDKLPTEHLLSKNFGVSRSVIREAIAQLRNENLVETRQGVGAFVTEPIHRQTLRIEQETLSNIDSFRSLFQLRMPLEIEAAGLAAAYHNSDDIKRLDEALDLMTGAEKWTEQGILADLAFHRALAVATHNEYFPLILGFIGERINLAINTARASAVLEEIVEVTITEHIAIRDAVVSGNPLKARDMMRYHIMSAAGRLNLNIVDF